MPEKGPAMAGFTALSDQVFVREGSLDDGAPARATDPDTVLIYGWGDGLPRHVAKYADGYRALYPRAKQVVVLSPIAKAMFSDLRQRTTQMAPVVGAAFAAGAGEGEGEGEGEAKRAVLVHTMSNTGAVNYAATLNAYREARGAALPHQLLVMDSTPGGTDMTASNVARWSRAMAMGTAGWFPWPAVVTQAIWSLALLLNGVYAWSIGRESAGAWSRRAANDAALETRAARRLYLYSQEDDLIAWQDVELHVAEARERGWAADTEVFRGSGHVGHMRRFPGQYWGAIGGAWRRAVGGEES
ncbi:hypothetical protein TOPH_08941 [Tolypocladium ophioglossoides CBS 100239]|uniref:Transmembrane protein 53 n=1 Tax=Tolypocladium ophioglossoides (strain CBS 100239) TaxID=1163406 RepID=A0A0L0MX23_TOLOC|nr:hypothetical protein TOPH_08941 [Tolypocladium ophioglossoides CBS 100239]